MSRSPLWRGVLLIALAFAALALSTTVRAVDPPPDGGYPNANTAEGDGALFSLTTGFGNTAIGANALVFNTAGNNNTASGYSALFFNTAGSYNTATGRGALYENTTGSFNTAAGYRALKNNITGTNNTATGYQALSYNTTGYLNTANGVQALHYNTTGYANVANGCNALFRNLGSSNTAIGYNALSQNTYGSYNIALGYAAGENLNSGYDNIDIANTGIASDIGTVRIGTAGHQEAVFVAGISSRTVPRGVGVIIDSLGHLGTVTSSARFKDEIKPMDKASEAILDLKPVTFRYKHDLDPEGIPQFGLVAEQVEKVNPDLVARDEQGKSYTVRYEAVNAMLLNEFLKEHRKVEELEATVAQQQRNFQKEIQILTASLKEQASQIQKVSNQLEVSKAVPQVVSNNR